MNVILLGYRGSGKTTIGQRLADRLWINFIDIDPQIVKQTGKPIKRIFDENGEEAFRDMESQLFAKALESSDTIISPGGGIILRQANRDLIVKSGAKAIYLRCEPATLLQRINQDPSTADNRPALTAANGGINEINQLLALREPLYRQAMTSELDVTNLTPDEAVHHISRMI
jgi:shikimate kinase